MGDRATFDEAALLEAALEAARAAVRVHARHLGRVRAEDVAEKGAADFVSHVDREAEARVIEVISGRFPDHAILAEEGATAVVERPAAPASPPPAARPHPAAPSPSVARETAHGAAADPLRAAADAEWLWVVDPLDGTTNFLHAYPLYSASVAVLHRGVPVAGVVASSATREEWTAIRGGGAYRNGARIQVSDVTRSKLALVGTGFPFKTPHETSRFLRQLETVLRHTAGVRRGGSAALDLCFVAGGVLDAFWELTLAPWDIAAGVLIVHEAGGLVSTIDGHPRDVLGGGSVLAGNPAMHHALRDLLRAADDPDAGRAAGPGSAAGR